MKIRFFLTFFFGYFVCFGQLETSNWYFGQYMGMKFQEDGILPLSDGNIFTGEGCATISDLEGNLLFYTDGSVVYNRNHQHMLNGRGLKGNSSSTQSAIIIPYPGQLNKYIIFTVGADDYATLTTTLNEGVNYYVVDMLLDDGLGGVIIPDNNNLLPLCSEKIAAVKHINKRDYWIVTHYGSKFYSFLVTDEGVNAIPIISQVGPDVDVRTYPVNSRGYLKISPNGKKLAVAHLSNLNYDSIPLDDLPTLSDQYYPTNGPFANAWPGYLGVYDFNKSTGVVSNEIVLDELGSPYGVEFSANNKVLYANLDYHEISSDNTVSWLRGELVQFNLDLSFNEIARSKNIIHTFRVQDTPSFIFTARGALQIALDQKIYYTREYKDYISCIQQPNDILNPMFIEVGYRFPYATYNVNTRYGLPPFVSSSFVQDIIINNSINSSFCFGEAMEFVFSNIDEATMLSYYWDFGNGDFSTEVQPSYIFPNSGTYVIRLTVNTIEYGMLYFNYSVTILDSMVINEANLYACDYDLDGYVIFDLAEADFQVVNQGELRFRYFITLEDALLDRNNINQTYVSSINGEKVFVRVINEQGCSQLTTITLYHQNPIKHILNPVQVCVYDEEVLINLTDYSMVVENYLSEESIINITYYKTENDLYAQRDPVHSLILFNEVKIVYARVKYFNKTCDDIVELKFNVSKIPIYLIDDIIKCKEDFALVSAPEGYTYEWIGLVGEDLDQDLNLNTIIVKNEGDYSVKIFNEFGCERIINFSVSNYTEIEVVDIFIDQSNSIVVQAIGEGLSYSIDGINWFNENVIVGLVSGNYTLYIRDINNCQIIVNNIFILNWTNFLSPNLDNINTNWEINGLEKYSGVEVEIFNRFGKVLVNKTMNFERIIWDGKYNGKKQPSDSYWYVIKIPGYVKYTGFVLLKNKI